jgi:hypothetical protein
MVYDMANLNSFEVLLLERLSIKYPNIKTHLAFLKVLNRENTGVGIYINFFYKDINILIPNLHNSSISTNEDIQVEGLQYGLGYEVSIIDGKIEFIELITYANEWIGDMNDFHVIFAGEYCFFQLCGSIQK